MNISKRNGHYLALLGLVVFTLYGFLLMPGASQAVSVVTIGQLGYEVVPVGTEPDQEYLRLRYDGAGFIDMTGWTIQMNEMTIATLPMIVLATDEAVRFCSDSNVLLNDCVPVWTGEVFPDGGSTFNIFDANGRFVLQASYGELGNSAMTGDSVDWVQPVYERRDSIQFCHQQKVNRYQLKKEQAGKIVANERGFVTEDAAVIPPFYHRIDGVIGYFAGKNWPDQEGLYTNGCQL